ARVPVPDVRAEGRALVGRAAPAPPPVFGHTGRPALPRPARVPVRALRLDLREAAGRSRLQPGAGPHEVPGAGVAEQASVRAPRGAGRSGLAGGRMDGAVRGLLPEHR